jgi:phage N-6-adenine-methyltransferase
LSFVAPNRFFAKNLPRQVRRSGADDKVDDRRTPDRIFDPLHAEHCFTIDAAASAENAKCAAFFDRAADGLAQSWAGHVVWLNPPYSDLYAWTAKALAEVAGGCLKVVMLLPANRTEQRWWQDLIEPIRDRGLGVTTRYLRGRVQFERSDGAPIKRAKLGGRNSPFGNVIVIIEPGPWVDRLAKANNETAGTDAREGNSAGAPAATATSAREK